MKVAEERKCLFMATFFLEMLRTVASLGCHDCRFICKCTEVTDNSCTMCAWHKYK